MAVEAFGPRLVVHRRDREDPVRADLGGVARPEDGLGGVIAPRAGDDRHAAVGHFDDGRRHGLALVAGEGRRLSRRPARHEEIDPALDLPVDEPLERSEVDAPLLVEGRDERRAAPLPVRLRSCFHSTSGAAAVASRPAAEDFKTRARDAAQTADLKLPPPFLSEDLRIRRRPSVPRPARPPRRRPARNRRGCGRGG